MRRADLCTTAACAWLLLAALPAQAESPVYRATDAWGRTVYSDKPAATASKPIRNNIAPDPGSARYYEAVTRAEIDRVELRRTHSENLQPRKIVTYDPRGSARQVPPYATPYAPPQRYRRDPALPAMPGPSTERNYYYSGR